jgi:hypothetical protein
MKYETNKLFKTLFKELIQIITRSYLNFYHVNLQKLISIKHLHEITQINEIDKSKE